MRKCATQPWSSVPDLARRRRCSSCAGPRWAGRSCGRSRAHTGPPRPWSSHRACGSRAARSSLMPCARMRGRPAHSASPRRSSATSGEIAIDLVGAGEDERHRLRLAGAAHRAGRSVPREVDVEILARVDQAGRHRDLGGEVEHGRGVAAPPPRPPPRRGCRRRTARIRSPWRRFSQSRLASTPGRVSASKTRTSWPSRRQPVGQVGADEAGAAGHEDRACRSRIDGLPMRPTGLRSCDQTSRLEFLRGLVDTVVRASAGHPFGEFGQALAEVALLARSPAPRCALLISAKQWRMSPMRALPSDFRLEFRPAHRARPAASATSRMVRSSPLPTLNTSPAASGCSSASTKARATSSTWTKSRRCAAVFEDHGTLPVQQARGEDGEHAGIGVRERLAGPVDIEEPQRDAFHAVGGRQRQREPLLHVFGERVDRGEAGPLPFRRRHGHRAGRRPDRADPRSPSALARGTRTACSTGGHPASR